ncbi:rubrerythrin [bacterium]|nr:MAG: rubrerythrin [bacterium]
MDKFQNVDAILDFAIHNEQEAVNFYSKLSQNSKNEEMKNVFQEFAQEEVKHKARLQKIKDDGVFVFSQEVVMDLKISDYTTPDIVSPDMSYQEILIVAMNREKAAFKLYTKLSSKTDDSNLKSLFLDLAQEESKHKLRFELEYDEYVLREN